jgi:hypothetical protein
MSHRAEPHGLGYPSIREGNESGAVEFLTKPVDEQDLLKAIKEAIELSSREYHAQDVCRFVGGSGEDGGEPWDLARAAFRNLAGSR